MAFASGGTIITIVTPKSAGTTSVLDIPPLALSAGYLVVVASAWDNAATSAGVTSQLSCADTQSNTYTKVSEYTQAISAADDGVCVGLWYSVLTTALSGADTITVTSSSSRTAKVSGAWYFTKGAGSTIAVEQVSQIGNALGEPGALNLISMPSREYLMLYAAGEGRGSTWTKDAAHTLMWDIESSGGSATTNVNLMGSFKIATVTDDSADAASSTDAIHAMILAALYEVTAAGDVAYLTAARR